MKTKTELDLIFSEVSMLTDISDATKRLRALLGNDGDSLVEVMKRAKRNRFIPLLWCNANNATRKDILEMSCDFNNAKSI
jgi:hypothetical protein